MSTLAILGWRPLAEVAWASEGNQLTGLRVQRLGRIKDDTWASGGLARGWCHQPPKPNVCTPVCQQPEEMQTSTRVTRTSDPPGGLCTHRGWGGGSE